MAPKRSIATMSGQALKKRMIGDSKMVAKALNAADLPASAKLTLCQVAPFCLATFADERHAIQEQAVDMIGRSLKSIEANKHRCVDGTRAEVEGMSKERLSVVVVQKARELAAKKGNSAFKEVELMQAETKLRGDADVLKAKLQLLEAGDVHYVHEADKHASVQALVDIIQGSHAVSGKDLIKFEKDLKAFGVDGSLAGVVGKTLPKNQEDRSDFEKATVSQLNDVLMAKALEFGAKVAELEPRHTELATAVKVAQAVQEKSMELQSIARNGLKEATSAMKKAALELQALEEDFKSFAKNVAAKQKRLADLDKDLNDFRQGTLAMYDTLRSCTAPQPQLAPETEDVEPASAEPLQAQQHSEMLVSSGQDPTVA